MKDIDQIQTARTHFIDQWGSLGSSWGVNRTMSQIHALLMSSPQPLTTDEVMEALQISRGNANTNLRELVDWNLVRSYVPKGARRTVFEAEKDVWKIFCAVAKERKRREIEPALATLHDCLELLRGTNDEEGKALEAQLRNLAEFVSLADNAMSRISRSERSKVLPALLKALGK